MSQPAYFSGQGRVTMALYTVDPETQVETLGNFYFVGNVPDYKVSFDTQTINHKESQSGQRQTDKIITTENICKVSATLEEWKPQNIALGLRGLVNANPVGTVVIGSPDLLNPVVVGDIMTLRGQHITLLEIVDSTAVTPLEPELGVDYLLDADFGTITWLTDPADFELPLKATYSYGATTSVAFFTQPITTAFVRFEGVNTADNNRKVLVENYRVALDPTKDLGLISNDLSKIVLGGNGLVDLSKAADPKFGSFGRMVYL